ncbi:hypothetical protein [Niveibacterium microcysteis]|uniref:Type I restriction endonuclease subunit M n=1 Tax=Niveibacterium microcysteis TaxID=2811415 RepID=A0ABX7MFI0_9RHOO|nr:hypothetical protein [Niveibacterium microcysteis]QSI78782.1 hypothetical protein JY500_09325 [Niveibacterium microcysteis]
MNAFLLPQPLFPLGRTLITPGALDLLANFNQSPSSLLFRHASGDWGCVCEEDATANTSAVNDGSRILSAFSVGGFTTVWIITEADRSSTTILLPEEY